MKVEFNFNQSGVIPYRIKAGHVEILLITSVKKKRWVIPKGYIEFNLSPFESAKKEAFEEAGIIGENETIELGNFENKKSIGICHTKVFAVKVAKILDEYPEKNFRKRKWFNLKEAAEAVRIPQISQMILSLDKKITA